MRRLLIVLLLLQLAPIAKAEEPAPADGPHAVLRDELLEKLVGEWNLRGTMMGSAAQQKLTVSWTLNHQFLLLHFEGVGEPPKGHARYDAMVYLGYDNLSERYVCHWIDVFGGRFSETLGYGARAANTVALVFEYPDGPFRTTFAFEPKTGTWKMSMRQKDKAGKWESFAEMDVTPAVKPAVGRQ